MRDLLQDVGMWCNFITQIRGALSDPVYFERRKSANFAPQWAIDFRRFRHFQALWAATTWYFRTTSTLCLKKGYHPTTNDNFNNSYPIPVIFGTSIAE